MGFSSIEASCDDFVSGRFSELWGRLSKETDKKKYSKFDLAKHGGCIETYLNSFDNELWNEAGTAYTLTPCNHEQADG
jgi:hypothetical protein